MEKRIGTSNLSIALESGRPKGIARQTESDRCADRYSDFARYQRLRFNTLD
ncbi:MAG: hypothetical protein WBA57_08205 [Elainellaceae cyanobacterium]